MKRKKRLVLKALKTDGYPEGALTSLTAAKRTLKAKGKIYVGGGGRVEKVTHLRIDNAETGTYYIVNDAHWWGSKDTFCVPFWGFSMRLDARGYFFDNYWFALAFMMQQREWPNELG